VTPLRAPSVQDRAEAGFQPPSLQQPHQKVLAAYSLAGGRFECFVSSDPNGTVVSLLRFESGDLVHWSAPSAVLAVPPDQGGALSLKTMARRPTGADSSALYSLLAFGYNSSIAEHLNVAYAWTSVDGQSWAAAVPGEALPFVFADHDDSMTIWHSPSSSFVDMQIT
jgi:hypothetical protein